MTDTEAPRTSADTPGWPPWRAWLIAANAVTILGVVAVHAWHAGSGSGVSYAVLGASRVCFAIAACVWPVCEINHWSSRRSTAALRAEIQAIHGAVDQLRRELAADMAKPLGQLAGAVDQVSARVDALAPRVDEHGDRRYLEGTQQVLDSLTPGGDVLPMPRRHAGVNNTGPVV